MQTTENATPNTLETVKKAIDMSERDFIATLAMQGILSNPFIIEKLMQTKIAKMKPGDDVEVQVMLEVIDCALKHADLMIAKSREDSAE